MTRTILHSDLNGFYASVEIMLDPALRGKAVAVCGSTEERHGIVLAKSEPAKKAGVRTGMANWEAKRACPELVILHPTYGQYVKYSRLAREIYQRFTDRVEPFGMDECWLDLTGCGGCEDGEAAAHKIRRTVKEELGLTVSIGGVVQQNIRQARQRHKEAGRRHRNQPVGLQGKDLAAAVLGAHLCWPRHEAQARRLRHPNDRGYRGRQAGISEADTGGQRRVPVDVRLRQRYLPRHAHGLRGADQIHRARHHLRRGPCRREEVFHVMLQLAQDVGHKLRQNDFLARGVEITVKDSKLAWTQYQAQLEVPSQSPAELAGRARILFNARYDWHLPVRAVTIRAINLIPKSQPVQLLLYDDTVRREKREKLEDAVEDIRARFGKKAIYNACLMGDLKMPGLGVHEVNLPAVMFQ